MNRPDTDNMLHEMGQKARTAYAALTLATPEQKTRALMGAAALIRARATEILSANAKDMEAARERDLATSLLDRLELNASRVEAIAKGLEQIAGLPDPIGKLLESWDVPGNGLHIEKISIPLGVIGIIYESRPNVTADAGGLCLKSGNAAILRAGSESFHSSQCLAAILREALAREGLPEDAIQMIPTRDREAVGAMLQLTEYIDVIVPRGGLSLTERVAKESRIPTILHLDGNCHTYIHASADAAMALRVVINAKLRRTGICGATESLLIDRAALATHLPPILSALLEQGVEIRGDDEVCALDARIQPASEADWGTEYLDKIISIKTVDGVSEATAHINRYGSHHTDAIIADDKAAQKQFSREVDSAIVAVNASTQFADGGEFGFGAEIGISTGRLHARGPVGAAQLTTYKYLLTGNGTVRT